jgi:hypothetical protein
VAVQRKQGLYGSPEKFDHRAFAVDTALLRRSKRVAEKNYER